MKSLTPPFQVRTIGLISDIAYHSTPGTRMDDIMLTIFIAGKGTYENSEGRLQIEANTVGLVPPEDCGILMANSTEPYTHNYCRFNGEYAKQLAREIIADRGRFFVVDDISELVDLIRRMGLLHREKLPDKMGLQEALLAEILVTLMRKSRAKSVNVTFASLKQYLRDHLAEPTDLSKMADHFQQSKANLCRLTRRITGQTIIQLSENMKIDWSKKLLHARTLNITEVAKRVGYADPFYFSRVFKKHTNQSPRDWRQN